MPEADDMAAAIAAAAAMENDAPDQSGPDASGGQAETDDESDSPGVLDGAGGAGGDDDGEADDADAGDDDGDESSGDADSEDVPKLSAVGQQIIDGDLAGACKLLGIDPKILKINVPKFEAMRKGLKETRTREAAAVAAETEAKKSQDNANAVMADAKEKYGQLVDLKLSLKAGDYYAAREILEVLAPEGKSIQDVLTGIAAAAKAQTPTELALRRQLRERDAKAKADKEAAEAAKAKETETAEIAARAERNKAGAEKLLKGTPFEGLPGATDALVKLASENWDPVKKGLKVKPAELVKLLAKDPVLSQLAELKRMKGKPAAPPAPPANRNKTRSANGQFQRPPPSGKKPDKAAQQEAERKASIAEAVRLEARDARARRAR